MNKLGEFKWPGNKCREENKVGKLLSDSGNYGQKLFAPGR